MVGKDFISHLIDIMKSESWIDLWTMMVATDCGDDWTMIYIFKIGPSSYNFWVAGKGWFPALARISVTHG